MRASEEVLACFYDLADFDENKRFNATIKILDACKSNGKYCMERLIGGLASSRAAARLGYTTAFTHALRAFSNDWPAEALFELADSKLDSTKAEGSAGVLGRHLLYTAMINSRCYAEVADELVERELAILDKHHYFAMAITQSVAELAKQLDKATFKTSVWTKIKSRVCKTFDSIAPEWLYFVLLIRDMFKETRKRDLSFFSDDGKLSIEETDYENVVNVLKRTEGCAEGVLAVELLSASREAGTFDIIYVNIVQRWLLNGDMHRVFERCFEFVNDMLSKQNLWPNELVIIFSVNFISILRSVKKSREYRFYRTTLESILQKLEKSVASEKWKRVELLSLLDSFDIADGGNFDEYFCGNLRITEKIIAHLDKKGVEVIVNKALNAGNWSVRRIANVFPVWPQNVREGVLIKLAKIEAHSQEVHTTLCKCIDSMFIINVRAGRSVKVLLSDENENVLRNVLNACAKKVKMPNTDTRPLTILALLLNIWANTSPHGEQQHAYLKAATEVVSIAEMLSHESTTEEPFSVLIDLLLSLLSRPYRYHRSLVHFVFASILPQLNIKNLLHIFETISLPDDEVMVDEKDDDEDGMSVEEHDLENGDERNEEHENTEDSEGKETDSELESSGLEGGDEEPVDQEFRGKLKAALGDAAMPSDAEGDDDEIGSVKSTVSDETMFRLDAGLAAVFRERMKGTRKASASTLEQVHQFRMKCFDLLLIVVSHEGPSEFTAEFILPLLRVARESLQKKNGEVSFKKATSLLEIIVKHRKGDVSEKKALKLLKKMVATSSQIVNPVLKTLVGTISSFLFSTAYNVEEQNASEKMRSRVEELFCSYMTQTDNEILSELATAPFFKYPWVFTSFLPRIIDFAFDKEVRIYRRTEALSCAIVFMRKDLAKESKANEKLWKKVAEKLAKHLHAYLSALNAEDAKPRFFALAIKLLTVFAGVASPERKAHLFEMLDSDLGALCENEELWKLGGNMKRFNSASQTICGRNTLAAIRQARVLIGGH